MIAEMSRETDENRLIEEASRGGKSDFVVSREPVVARETRHTRAPESLGQLPRSYGAPVLFAIARDPHTIFVYWDINWAVVFRSDPPPDRKVHLRVFAEGDSQESSTAVEPLAANCYLNVSRAPGSYRIEIGYDRPDGVWSSVAVSGRVMTPAEDVAQGSPIDVATVPFHVSFQRLVDVFRASKYDGEALTEILGRMQERAADPARADSVTATERELLRAIDWTLSETEARDRARLRETDNTLAKRQKAEEILGFGATSPRAGFGPSRRA